MFLAFIRWILSLMLPLIMADGRGRLDEDSAAFRMRAWYFGLFLYMLIAKMVVTESRARKVLATARMRAQTRRVAVSMLLFNQ